MQWIVVCRAELEAKQPGDVMNHSSVISIRGLIWKAHFKLPDQSPFIILNNSGINSFIRDEPVALV